MPKKKPRKVPRHEHRWYAISYDADGKPWLWACGVFFQCGATTKSKMKGRGKARTLSPPEPVISEPTNGIFGVTQTPVPYTEEA